MDAETLVKLYQGINLKIITVFSKNLNTAYKVSINSVVSIIKASTIVQVVTYIKLSPLHFKA